MEGLPIELWATCRAWQKILIRVKSSAHFAVGLRAKQWGEVCGRKMCMIWGCHGPQIYL